MQLLVEVGLGPRLDLLHFLAGRFAAFVPGLPIGLELPTRAVEFGLAVGEQGFSFLEIPLARFQPLGKLRLLGRRSSQRRRDGSILSILPIEGMLTLVQLPLATREGFALTALFGLSPLAGLGLFAVGPRQFFLSCGDVAFARGHFGLSVGEFLLPLAKPEPRAAGIVFLLSQLGVEV